MMWEKLDLRIKIYSVLGLLIFITLLGGAVMLWYTYRIENLLIAVTEKNLSAYQSAESLAISLVNQKGFVSYYFMDGDPDWLKQLGEYRQIFKDRLEEAKVFSESIEEGAILETIDDENRKYVDAQDIVISHYEAGEQKAGEALHYETRKRFFRILDLCSRYKELHRRKIIRLEQDNKIHARNLRLVAVSGMSAALLLGVILAFILVGSVMAPLRKLAAVTGRTEDSLKTKNIVQNLSQSVHGLIQDYDETAIRLEKSQESLLQAEKMVLVGKLAAGMAHSIRNPFTSIQMRLFSLRRSLVLNDIQKEDFDVISEEVKHIDTIVHNFLEFSRAPKLKFQSISPSTIIDMTLQLLKHRLSSYDVDVKLLRRNPLPEVEADPEQIKEVFVNVIINACEVMPHGGIITIREETRSESSGRIAVISLEDNGPGISDTVREKLFEPFFSTKEEGTGLGLSIARRIVEEHRGSIRAVSREGQGTTFNIQLPVKEGGFD